jgi:hypothetical protein
MGRICVLLGAAMSVAAFAADRIIVGPPIETAEKGQSVYQPLVELLSERTGADWSYEHTGDWLSYVDLIVSDRADLAFNQAHFAGYLALYHNHRFLARIPGETQWLLFGGKDSDGALPGQSVCVNPPPDLGNLVLATLDALADPMRAPYMVAVKDRDESFSGIRSGRCAYTVAPEDALSAAERDALKTWPLTKIPGVAITASSRIDDQIVSQIQQALLSPEGQAATAPIREHYALSQDFTGPGNTNPYLLVSFVLVEGYLMPMQRMDKAFEAVQKRAEEVASEGGEEWLERVDPMLVSDIRAVQQLASNRVLRDAVIAQNSRNTPLERIKVIDQEWSGTSDLTPFKLSLQNSEAGTVLKQSVRLNPSYTELFLTDNQGANVAAYPATSDYWQGDEDKFYEAYVGNGLVWVGELEYDESTRKYAVQVSVPVYDHSDTMSGVLVAGLVVDYLRWKEQQELAKTQ